MFTKFEDQICYGIMMKIRNFSPGASTSTDALPVSPDYSSTSRAVLTREPPQLKSFSRTEWLKTAGQADYGVISGPRIMGLSEG